MQHISKHQRESAKAKGLNMAKKADPAGDEMQADNTLTIQQSPEETGAQALARKLLQPSFKNAIAASAFTDKALGGIKKPGLADYATYVQNTTEKAGSGDVDMASRILSAQAIALDSMFAELARRTALNMGDYVNAAERYGRLALKAQSNCRATLEALAKLHQPREQTVRHVHVNDGGQAIVADEFHNHLGGAKIGKSNEQSDAAGALGECAALPGADASGSGVPISSRERA